VFTLARAVTYAVLFIAFFLVYLPARVLAWAGIKAPPAQGLPQVAGILLLHFEGVSRLPIGRRVERYHDRRCRNGRYRVLYT
jgi:hypothetical protein